MRILLIASLMDGNSSGLGGHYNSMRDLRRAFQDGWPDADIYVMTIGNIQPVVFRGDEQRVEHVDTAHKSLRAIRTDVNDIVERIAPTHIHAFDNKSYAFARGCARRVGAKLYLTRPGGPNPLYFPQAPDIVCFSRENAEYLRAKKKYHRSRIHVIPQRVLPPQWDRGRSEEIVDLTDGRPILLRVARLTELNRPSILQTIELSKLLRAHNVDHSMVIVGTPNSPELLMEIRAALAMDDVLITDERFTTRAEQLTGVARAIVGSGRTLVEAAMAGSVLYSPLAGRSLPTLVTSWNQDALAKRNFSARSVIPDRLVSSEQELVSAFIEGRSEISADLAAQMRIGADVLSRYRSMYAEEQDQAKNMLDELVNWASFVVPRWRTNVQEFTHQTPGISRLFDRFLRRPAR